MTVEDGFNARKTTLWKGVQTGLAIVFSSSSDSVSESDETRETTWAGKD